MATNLAIDPARDLSRRGDYPKLGTIVGRERQLQSQIGNGATIAGSDNDHLAIPVPQAITNFGSIGEQWRAGNPANTLAGAPQRELAGAMGGMGGGMGGGGGGGPAGNLNGDAILPPAWSTSGFPTRTGSSATASTGNG